MLREGCANTQSTRKLGIMSATSCQQNAVSSSHGSPTADCPSAGHSPWNSMRSLWWLWFSSDTSFCRWQNRSLSFLFTTFWIFIKDEKILFLIKCTFWFKMTSSFSFGGVNFGFCWLTQYLKVTISVEFSYNASVTVMLFSVCPWMRSQDHHWQSCSVILHHMWDPSLTEPKFTVG